MTRRSDHPDSIRKSKLKMRFYHRLDAELARTMNRALLLGELICDKRAEDMRAKIDAMPKPCHLPIKPLDKPVLVRVPRMNDWGLVK